MTYRKHSILLPLGMRYCRRRRENLSEIPARCHSRHSRPSPKLPLKLHENDITEYFTSHSTNTLPACKLLLHKYQCTYCTSERSFPNDLSENRSNNLATTTGLDSLFIVNRVLYLSLELRNFNKRISRDSYEIITSFYLNYNK